ncbi:hypothetical protein ACFE04_027708 [Oxalis oulophora]
MQVPVFVQENDLFAWRSTKNLIFSVKSAYQVAKGISEISSEKDPWSRIWSINVPPKVKHFLWRHNLQSFPTRDFLALRGFSFKSCEDQSKVIKAIPLSDGAVENQWCWEENDMGVYTVRYG